MSDYLFDHVPLMPPAKNPARKVSQRALDWQRRAGQRLAKMHQMYGHGPEGTTCKGCVFLERHSQARSWLKCRKAGVTASEATDWRAKWPACGAYKEADA